MIKSVDYMDGFQYVGGELNFFPHAEGYVKATAATPTNTSYYYDYVYNYTDHLGNVRLSYSKDPQTNQLKILEENHYYPFGLKHSVYTGGRLRDFEVDFSNPEEEKVFLTPVTKTEYQYKYNGKEWQDELGLNMYAMDMRQYDPAIGRWVAQDPVIHHSMSPYNAFDNNPVFWADPSGANSVFDQQGTSYSSITTATGMSISAGGAGDGDNGKNNGDPEKGSSNTANNNSKKEGSKEALKGKSSSNLKKLMTTLTTEFESDGEVIATSSVSQEIFLMENIEPIGGHVFAGLETVMGQATNYLIGQAFDAFGWNKDYQDEVSMALSLVVNKGKPNKVTANTGIKTAIPKGFKETKKFGYQHGQKVYEYKGKYYSRDVGSGNGRGSHNGGEWKVFEQRNGKLHRIGTADGNLSIFKK